MRFIILLLAALTFVGCASETPYNPLNRSAEPLWWQRTTIGVSKADNPWEKFNQPQRSRDVDDLWADFEEPKLFTDEFFRRLKEEPKTLNRTSHSKEI